MLPDSQAIYVDLRRSGSPGTRKSPSPPTELGVQEPKEPSLKTKITRKLELQEKAESEEPSQGCASGIPLQDSPCDLIQQDFATSILVQDHDTSVPLQDSHTDVLLAEDILKSPFGAQSQCASRDTPPSPVPGGEPIANRPSSRGQQEPNTPPADELGKSQGKPTASTHEREDPKSPKLEENEKGFAERRASQASRLSHPPQLRRTGDSLGNKYLHLMPEEGHIFPESHFRKRMRHFLHCLTDNKKGKGLEDPLQTGKPASAAVQGRGAVRGSLVMDGRAAEAQTVMTAVGHILVEKLGPPQELRASETNQPKEFQGPGGGRCCCHGVLAYPDLRGVMRETASNHQATPKAHGCPNESQQTRDGGGRWVFPPREPGSPGRPRLCKPMAAGASGHVRHHPACSLQKCVSCHQAVGASHVFPGRRAFLQEKMEHTQRKPVSSA
uniref:Uncharacterized protein n=2 Tax=Suricata suricatta TaxID=37032 RepID=A0A673VFQ6_SURSU